MHVAMVVALVGIAGTASRLLPALAAGQFARPAVLAQLVTTLLLAWYLGQGHQVVPRRPPSARLAGLSPALSR